MRRRGSGHTLEDMATSITGNGLPPNRLLPMGIPTLLLTAVLCACSAQGVEPPPSTSPSNASTSPAPESTPGPTEPTPQPTRVRPPRPEPGAEVPAPPHELVGRWNGGPGDSSDWYLTIRADGSWSLVNDDLGLTDAGLVDATDQGFEMYNGTGDARIVDAAGINACKWNITRSLGMTFLYFCDGPLSAWVPAD